MEPILSISEIFYSYLKDDEYMVIPSYQRGYEWDADDIRILLDDIANFTVAGLDDDKFYCLQHITLIKKNDKDGHTFYNIVDGQQRITTLAIILSFYGKGQMFENKLRYEVRTETGKFLKDYIFTRKYWSENYSEKPRHKDEYYIMQAANIVREWKPETPKQKDFSLEDFIDALLAKVKIIVNDVSGNEETVFANINGVKAELDGADLLRAVQITRSAEEKYETSDSDTHKENKVYEYRVKMGMELDAINLWCNIQEVRKYLELFLPDNAFEKSGFFVKDHPIDYLYRMMYEIHSDKTAKFEFRFFEYGLNKNSKNNDDNWEMYEELKNIYSSLYDWYGDKEIYHYSAFLFSQYKSKVNFKNIYEEWEKKGTSKKKFAGYLKSLIVQNLLSPFRDENEGSGNSQDNPADEKAVKVLLTEISDIQHNWYGDPMSSTILVLSDVILCTRKNSLNRLPIDRFRRNSEDIEHIGCRTPNEEDCADTDKWRAYIEEIEKSGIDIEKDTIKRWKASLESSSDTQKQIDKIVSELNAYGLNSIGNLVLLDLSVNRCYDYRNASFHKKKTIILSHYFGNVENIKGKSEEKVKPIRPYTLKAFTSEEDNKWTLEDIRKTAEALSSTIKNFIA